MNLHGSCHTLRFRGLEHELWGLELDVTCISVCLWQVMLDTENKFVSTGMAKEIAAAAGGRYHYIPKASDKAIASVAAQAMQGL